LSISHEHCAPFLSTTFIKLSKSGATVALVRDAILEELKSNLGSGVRRRISKVDNPIWRQGDTRIGWIVYSETRAPPWYLGHDLKEERHHIVVLIQRSGLVSVIFSDPAIRKSVVAEIRKQRKSRFAGLELLTAKQINDAFVGSRVRTLWLSGAHRRSVTKADSKILTGLELEAALDPLEDQSYYFSSVRSTIPGIIDDAGSDTVVGANPRNARIWLGPSRDWPNFVARTESLIDAAAQAIKKPLPNAAPLPILAQPVEGLSVARMAYDLAIIDPETSLPGLEESEKDPWLHEFADAAHFEISPIPDSPSFDAEVFWGAESYGKIRYEFSIGSDLSPSVTSQVLAWKTRADHQDAVRQLCESCELLTVYYDTGHTYSRGMFYETRFRDARFENWKWLKLQGFDVTAEKPLEGKKFVIKKIGSDKDNSLFGFTAKHWPILDRSARPTGWLICDDGSMESADFIHFDPSAKPPHLTLIHVKASSKSGKRQLSVPDYEVVVSQAVKNLRYLDREHISEKLNSNKDNQIGAAVWRDGKRQNNRENVLKLLTDAGSNMKKTVCIFQPRATRSEVERLGKQILDGDTDSADVLRLRQLDGLLLAARAECFGLGADFFVLGEDDVQ
jgi:hypothetical protein